MTFAEFKAELQPILVDIAAGLYVAADVKLNDLYDELQSMEGYDDVRDNICVQLSDIISDLRSL